MRVLVPVVLLALGAVLAFSLLRSPNAPGSPAASKTPPGQKEPVVPGAPAAGTIPPTPVPTPANTGATPPVENAAGSPPTTPAGPIVAPAGLIAKSIGEQPAFTPIGALDPKGQLKFELQFSPIGAGIASLKLAEHFDSIERKAHVELQKEHVWPATSPSEAATPMALRDVEINGQRVSLSGVEQRPGEPISRVPCWRQIAPGSFEAIIIDGEGKPVARIERTYALEPESHEIDLRQKFENLTDQPMTIRVRQFGPVDLPQEAHVLTTGDKRRIRYGYLLNPTMQGGDPTVSSNDFLWPRASLLGSHDATGQYHRTTPTSIAGDGRTTLFEGGWPNARGFERGYRLSWFALTNRYFGVALHPIVKPTAGPNEKVFALAQNVERFWVPNGSADPTIVTRLTSDAFTVAAKATQDLSMGIHAGPLSRAEIKRDEKAAAVGLPGLVQYNFGGMCGWCTFPWLTTLLLALLRTLHDYVVFDWALAIMGLVLIVRTILHPVTKWSQVRMQRWGKSMQAMAPKQKQIQEKYKNDPQKMREEIQKLWREEGVNPAGALGCLPMFLQTPVWIALYAMLYFAVELRHEPAFFGIFQSIAPGFPKFFGWFLGDLAEPDRFIYFGHTVITIPLIGPIDSLNVLPLLLGVVFYIQQKYLTPPSAPGSMSPEQEQTQFMMKIMTVIMFPLFMYNSPSGLTIYFLTNSTLGILESRYIRRHVDKYDLANPKKKATTGGKKGFMARMLERAEERRKMLEQMQKGQATRRSDRKR